MRKSIDIVDLVAYSKLKLENIKDPKKVEEFLSKELSTLSDISNMNPFQTLPQRKSLRRAITILSHPRHHRVWLEDNDNKLVGVISQSKAAEILLDHKDALLETMKSPIKVLFPEARQVISVFYKDSLLSAFVKIQETRVSGLAVVDEDFTLRGNISATDLKYGDWSDPMSFLNELEGSIEDFINTKQGKHFAKGQHQFKPVVATPDEPLQNVMQKTRENKVHRVYVVDNKHKPQYVLSLSDMIGQFTLYPIPGSVRFTQRG